MAKSESIPNRSRPWLTFALSVFTIIIVFIIDLITPFGYIHWVFYIVPLLIIYKAENVGFTVIILLLCGLFMYLGRVVESEFPQIEDVGIVDTVNRMEGFLALAAFNLIIISLIRSHRYYEQLSRKLEYANSELESFSYSAAHDLRTPVTIIKSFSTIIKDDSGDKLDGETVDYINRIIKTADQMSKLIDDMLYLSKISLQEINPVIVDMSEMAATIMDDLKNSSPKRVAQISIHPNLKVKADKNLLKIALSNLLGNAWKYTSKNEMTEIEFGIKQKREKLLFFVQDNGVGFDMNNASQLFKPFHRLHSDKDFKGTGIGLSIVERIIIKHNGIIWAESQVGRGAAFYFTIPQ